LLNESQDLSAVGTFNGGRISVQTHEHQLSNEAQTHSALGLNKNVKLKVQSKKGSLNRGIE
jgi:hypothetical protein